MNICDGLPLRTGKITDRHRKIELRGDIRRKKKQRDAQLAISEITHARASDASNPLNRLWEISTVISHSASVRRNLATFSASFPPRYMYVRSRDGIPSCSFTFIRVVSAMKREHLNATRNGRASRLFSPTRHNLTQDVANKDRGT